MATYIVEDFRNITELIHLNETRKPNKVFTGREMSSNEIGRRGFTKTETYDEAVKLLKYGYDEPLAEIKKGVETNIKGLTSQKTAVKNDIIGYAPCVPNAILGIPNSMINKELTVKKSKIITIVYDTTSNASTDSRTFIDAGIATLTIVNSLESQGYRVALKVAFKNSACGGTRTIATVNVKDWRQPLDLKKITFPFCHPSMLRRIGFRWLETTPNLTESGYYGGYGRSMSGCVDYRDIVNELKDKGFINENDLYINIDLCQRKDFDAQRIASAAGLKI